MTDRVREKEQEPLTLPNVVTEEKDVSKDESEVLGFNNWGREKCSEQEFGSQ